MNRRSWITSILTSLMTLVWSRRSPAQGRSFVITERDVSGFVITCRKIPSRPPTPTSNTTLLSQEKGAAGQTVYLYSASWCRYCPAVKKTLLETKDLPFSVEVIDVDHPEEGKGYPPGFESLPRQFQTLPHLEWDTPNGRVYTKWKDLSDLKGKWHRSQKKVAKIPVGYRPRWTWPGSLSQHLTIRHGVDVAGLTQDEMEALHDRLHEGR